MLKGLSTPVDLISFEYNTQPRLIGIAAECIAYLNGLDDYCFNYQSEMPERQNLQLETWVDAGVMRYILEHDIARQLCFGDVFARRRRAKQSKRRSAAGFWRDRE